MSEEEVKHHEVKDNQDESISISNPFIWIIGAVILLLVGWFSVKTLFFSEENYKVTLVDAPAESVATQTTTFTWRIDGPSIVINHTSVHLGLVSNPGELGKDVKPGDTKYTDFVRDFANGTYNIPLQFIGNIKIDQPGKYYFRVHALIKDKNYWTDEYTLDVKPKSYGVSFLFKPKDTEMVNTPVNFTWYVDGLPTIISSTAVYFGKKSTPGKLGKDIRPTATEYTEYLKDFSDGKYDIPLQFISNLKVGEPGKYYYRVHALIKSENYWSDEYSFEAVAGGPEVKATVTGSQ